MIIGKLLPPCTHDKFKQIPLCTLHALVKPLHFRWRVSVLLCETGIVLSHATTGYEETALIYIINSWMWWRIWHRSPHKYSRTRNHPLVFGCKRFRQNWHRNSKQLDAHLILLTWGIKTASRNPGCRAEGVDFWHRHHFGLWWYLGMQSWILV